VYDYEQGDNIFWVSPRVPIGPARPKALENLGRPVALQIGLEAMGPGPRPGPGWPIPILDSDACL